MKKQKLKLQELKVKSFTTILSSKNSETVNGGITGWFCKNSTILITAGGICEIDDSWNECGPSYDNWC